MLLRLEPGTFSPCTVAHNSLLKEQVVQQELLMEKRNGFKNQDCIACGSMPFTEEEQGGLRWDQHVRSVRSQLVPVQNKMATLFDQYETAA